MSSHTETNTTDGAIIRDVLVIEPGTYGVFVSATPDQVVGSFREGNDLVIMLVDGSLLVLQSYFAWLRPPAVLARDADEGRVILLKVTEDGEFIGQELVEREEIGELFSVVSPELPLYEPEPEPELAETAEAPQEQEVTEQDSGWDLGLPELPEFPDVPGLPGEWVAGAGLVGVVGALAGGGGGAEVLGALVTKSDDGSVQVDIDRDGSSDITVSVDSGGERQLEILESSYELDRRTVQRVKSWAQQEEVAVETIDSIDLGSGSDDRPVTLRVDSTALDELAGDDEDYALTVEGTSGDVIEFQDGNIVFLDADETQAIENAGTTGYNVYQDHRGAKYVVDQDVAATGEGYYPDALHAIRDSDNVEQVNVVMLESTDVGSSISDNNVEHFRTLLGAIDASGGSAAGAAAGRSLAGESEAPSNAAVPATVPALSQLTEEDLVKLAEYVNEYVQDSADSRDISMTASIAGGVLTMNVFLDGDRIVDKVVEIEFVQPTVASPTSLDAAAIAERVDSDDDGTVDYTEYDDDGDGEADRSEANPAGSGPGPALPGGLTPEQQPVLDSILADPSTATVANFAEIGLASVDSETRLGNMRALLTAFDGDAENPLSEMSIKNMRNLERVANLIAEDDHSIVRVVLLTYLSRRVIYMDIDNNDGDDSANYLVSLMLHGRTLAPLMDVDYDDDLDGYVDRTETDSDGDGTVDVIIGYRNDPNGSVDRTETDRNADGTYDEISTFHYADANSDRNPEVYIEQKYRTTSDAGSSDDVLFERIDIIDEDDDRFPEWRSETSYDADGTVIETREWYDDGRGGPGEDQGAADDGTMDRYILHEYRGPGGAVTLAAKDYDVDGTLDFRLETSYRTGAATTREFETQFFDEQDDGTYEVKQISSFAADGTTKLWDRYEDLGADGTLNGNDRVVVRHYDADHSRVVREQLFHGTNEKPTQEAWYPYDSVADASVTLQVPQGTDVLSATFVAADPTLTFTMDTDFDGTADRTVILDLTADFASSTSMTLRIDENQDSTAELVSYDTNIDGTENRLEFDYDTDGTLDFIVHNDEGGVDDGRPDRLEFIDGRTFELIIDSIWVGEFAGIGTVDLADDVSGTTGATTLVISDEMLTALADRDGNGSPDSGYTLTINGDASDRVELGSGIARITTGSGTTDADGRLGYQGTDGIIYVDPDIVHIRQLLGGIFADLSAATVAMFAQAGVGDINSEARLEKMREILTAFDGDAENPLSEMSLENVRNLARVANLIAEDDHSIVRVVLLSYGSRRVIYMDIDNNDGDDSANYLVSLILDGATLEPLSDVDYDEDLDGYVDREETDGDGDGTADEIIRYHHDQNGKVERTETDRDADGTYDEISTFHHTDANDDRNPEAYIEFKYSTTSDAGSSDDVLFERVDIIDADDDRFPEWRSETSYDADGTVIETREWYDDGKGGPREDQGTADDGAMDRYILHEYSGPGGAVTLAAKDYDVDGTLDFRLETSYRTGAATTREFETQYFDEHDDGTYEVKQISRFDVDGTTKLWDRYEDLGADGTLNGNDRVVVRHYDADHTRVVREQLFHGTSTDAAAESWYVYDSVTGDSVTLQVPQGTDVLSATFVAADPTLTFTMDTDFDGTADRTVVLDLTADFASSTSMTLRIDENQDGSAELVSYDTNIDGTENRLEFDYDTDGTMDFIVHNDEGGTDDGRPDRLEFVDGKTFELTIDSIWVGEFAGIGTVDMADDVSGSTGATTLVISDEMLSALADGDGNGAPDSGYTLAINGDAMDSVELGSGIARITTGSGTTDSAGREGYQGTDGIIYIDPDIVVQTT